MIKKVEDESKLTESEKGRVYKADDGLYVCNDEVCSGFFQYHTHTLSHPLSLFSLLFRLSSFSLKSTSYHFFSDTRILPPKGLQEGAGVPQGEGRRRQQPDHHADVFRRDTVRAVCQRLQGHWHQRAHRARHHVHFGEFDI